MIEAPTEQIYTFIADYIEEHDYGPSMRDIAAACYVSVGTVMRHLDKLEAKGRISREPGRARSIRLITPEPLSE